MLKRDDLLEVAREFEQADRQLRRGSAEGIFPRDPLGSYGPVFEVLKVGPAIKAVHEKLVAFLWTKSCSPKFRIFPCKPRITDGYI